MADWCFWRETDGLASVPCVDGKGRSGAAWRNAGACGSEAEDVSLAKITGPGFDEDGVIAAVEKVTDVYLEARADGERFLDTYRRIGMEPFKEALYG